MLQNTGEYGKFLGVLSKKSVQYPSEHDHEAGIVVMIFSKKEKGIFQNAPFDPSRSAKGQINPRKEPQGGQVEKGESGESGESGENSPFSIYGSKKGKIPLFRFSKKGKFPLFRFIIRKRGIFPFFVFRKRGKSPFSNTRFFHKKVSYNPSTRLS